MRKAFEVNEKLMILTIILGFIFGIYLAIGHDDPNLWFVVVQWIFLTAIIMTVIAFIAGMTAKTRTGEELTVLDIIRIFALNLAIVAVCTSFGFVFGSIAIGNFNTAN